MRWTLFGMVAVWSLVFIALGYRRHAHFGTFGFDLGIYDQGIWLLSRFKDPFVTVRGLDLFGHHMNVILLLFVPFYWLGAGPIFLLVTQVLSQASGAIAVFLLARDRLEAAVAGGGPQQHHPPAPDLPVPRLGVLPSRCRWPWRRSCSPIGRPGPSGGSGSRWRRCWPWPARRTWPWPSS